MLKCRSVCRSKGIPKVAHDELERTIKLDRVGFCHSVAIAKTTGMVMAIAVATTIVPGNCVGVATVVAVAMANCHGRET